MKFDSLAMIETNGLVSALVAVDKMLSIGNVEFLKKDVIPNGQVTVFIVGNSSEIKRVLDAGVITAQKAGIVISSGIVPYPNDTLEKIIFESTTSTNKSKKVKKNFKKKDERTDTLFDQFDDEASFNDLMAEVDNNNLDVAGKIFSFKHPDQNEDALEDETSKSDSNLDDDNEKKLEISSNAQEQVSEISVEVLNNEKEKINSDKKIKDSDGINKTEGDNNESVEIEQESSEIEDVVEEIPQKNIEKISEEKTVFEGMSHIEQLRAEAKSEIESEVDNEQSITKFDEIKSPSDKVQNVKLSTDQLIEVKTEDEEIIDSELSVMNVHELRKLARSKEDFPIKGREISKANRKKLLDYFAQL